MFARIAGNFPNVFQWRGPRMIFFSFPGFFIFPKADNLSFDTSCDVFFLHFTFFSRPTTPPRRRLLFSAFFSKTAPIVPALGSPTPRHAADCRICQICYSFGMFRQIYYKQIYKHLPIVDKFLEGSFSAVSKPVSATKV